MISVHRTRPATIWLALALLGFLGVAAVGGGLVMAADPTGGLIGMPVEWIEPIPFLSDWLVPGLFLAVWFGVGSLVTLGGMLTGWGRTDSVLHWSWWATVALGVTQVAWIVIELIVMPETLWIQGLMACVGALLVILMLQPSARNHLRSVHSDGRHDVTFGRGRRRARGLMIANERRR